jgi:predicted nucleotide-binding protein (sugar kinase/HSP70/actin superfamily)
MDRLSNQVHPMMQLLFRSSDVVFKMTVSPFAQLELFSQGMKSMKVNCSVFPSQHSHQISTSLNYSG